VDNSKVPFFAILAIFAVKELPLPGLSASKRRAVTNRHGKRTAWRIINLQGRR
jgi:hypothetical protein